MEIQYEPLNILYSFNFFLPACPSLQKEENQELINNQQVKWNLFPLLYSK